MSRNLKRLADVSLWLSAILVLTLAAAILLVKLALPYVDNYREQIESNLSQISGYQIRIDNISASLEGLDPRFTIQGVKILAEGEQDPLFFERLMIQIDFWQSVKKRAPEFRYIRFFDTHIRLTEEAGNWSLTGLAMAPSNGGGFSRIANYLLDQKQILLSSTELSISSERFGQFSLQSKALYLQKSKAGIGLSAQIKHEKHDEIFSLKAMISGNLNQADSFVVKAEIDLPKLSLSAEELKEFEQAKLAKVDLGTKLWLTYENRQDFSIVGQLNLSPTFASGQALNLGTQLRSHYSLDSKRLTLQLSDVEINQAETNYPVANILLDADFAQSEYDLAFDQLDLSIVSQLALPYMKESWFVTGLIDAMKAQGQARNGHLKIQNQDRLSFAYEGNLAIESSQGYRNIPSIKSLDAILTLQDKQGEVRFASNKASLAFPLMYQEEWQTQGLAGSVAWLPEADALQVTGKNLYINRHDAEIHGGFDLLLSQTQTNELTLNLNAKNVLVRDGLGYVPSKVLPSAAMDWLDGALLDGKAKSTEFYLKAPLEKGLKPIYSVALELEEGVIKFAPDWPEARQVDAHVRIDNSGVTSAIDFVQLDKVETQALVFNLPFSQTGLSYFRLQGSVEENLADVMGLLSQTNLATGVLKPFQTWELEGQGQADFNLLMPISSQTNETPYFNLDLGLSDAQVRLNDLRLSAQVREGQLNFDTQKGIQDSWFNLDAFSGRSRLDLFTKGNQTNPVIHGVLSGDAAISDVLKWQKVPSILQRNAEGNLNYLAQFYIDPKEAGKFTFKASSSLKGVSLSLPQPFAKTKNLITPFDISVDIEPEFLDLDLTYDKNYRTKLRFNKSGFYGGHALIAEADNVPYKIEKGLKLQGQLPHVELAAWRKLFNSQESEEQEVQPLRLFVPDWLTYLHLISDQVRLNEENILHNVKLKYDRGIAPSDILLTSEEIGVKLSKDLHGPVVNFSYLSWHMPDEKRVSGAADSSSSRIRVQQIPSMTLNIDQLVVNEKSYGDWYLMLTQVGDRLRIDPLSTELADGDFSGSVFWQDDDNSNVEFVLAVEGEDIDELARKFTSEPLMTSKKYKIDVNLSWLGTPFDIQRETLSGRINFSADAGEIKKITELPSFLKALGVFNLHSLARRLTLDFSDVSSEGLTYDKVSTVLAIQEGQLKTQAPLKVISPSVEIELKGTADLVNETLDENLVASFPLGNALPIAGYLLGMPQVAGILYITDKLFGSQLSKVTSVEYTIKGPFDDPIIAPVIHTPKTNNRNRDK